MIETKKFFAVFLLLFVICFAGQNASANHSTHQTSRFFLPDKFLRTELYFGTDITGGGRVSEADLDKFLETEVTPRFPDGFTVLDGFGQFKDSSGKIVREASKVLILFYPKKTRKTVDQKVEEIRTAYKKQFKQESVLRFDFLSSVNVKF